MQPNEQVSSCGCGGSIPIEDASTDQDETRYKFDFGVEQPRSSEPEPQMQVFILNFFRCQN